MLLVVILVSVLSLPLAKTCRRQSASRRFVARSESGRNQMTRNLDAARSPIAFFGAELRRVRLAADLSQDQLGRKLSFSGDLVGKIETCERAPTPTFAAGCDDAFPHLDGLFTRLLELGRRYDGPYPQ